MTSIDNKIRQKGYNSDKDFSIVRNSIFDTVERNLPSGRWRKKYPCRRLKGEHKFVFIKEWGFFETLYKEYKCEACGKKASKFIKKTKTIKPNTE